MRDAVKKAVAAVVRNHMRCCAAAWGVGMALVLIGLAQLVADYPVAAAGFVVLAAAAGAFAVAAACGRGVEL